MRGTCCLGVTWPLANKSRKKERTRDFLCVWVDTPNGRPVACFDWPRNRMSVTKRDTSQNQNGNIFLCVFKTWKPTTFDWINRPLNHSKHKILKPPPPFAWPLVTRINRPSPDGSNFIVKTHRLILYESKNLFFFCVFVKFAVSYCRRAVQ